MKNAGNVSAPEVITTVAELRTRSAQLLSERSARGNRTSDQENRGFSGTPKPSVALVPTMGALHRGHAELVRQARAVADVVVVSVFVNPLQFGDSADLERYPRSLEADLKVVADEGADLLFAPGVEQMYPAGQPMVSLNAGAMARGFEGASRPGHFDGMLTVVMKLLQVAMPAVSADFFAFFGQKDAQQLAIVRRMVADLNIPAQIRAVPIVRDDDGLALSSRNRFLGEQERRVALALPSTLEGLKESWGRGGLRDEELQRAREKLSSIEGIDVDYLEIVDPESFEPVRPKDAESGNVIILAARVGSVRLLDNAVLD